MSRIILASQSPRRKQLLSQIGIKGFEIIVPEADETFDPSLPPEEIVASICRKKGEAARALAGDPEAVIISADTMVFFGGPAAGGSRGTRWTPLPCSPPSRAGPIRSAPA